MTLCLCVFLFLILLNLHNYGICTAMTWLHIVSWNLCDRYKHCAVLDLTDMYKPYHCSMIDRCVFVYIWWFYTTLSHEIHDNIYPMHAYHTLSFKPLKSRISLPICDTCFVWACDFSGFINLWNLNYTINQYYTL